MSKLDIGVGDEFPLDEPHDSHRGRRGHHRHGHHHHGHHKHRHHGHRGRHGVGRLALLLVIAGVVALIVEHRLTADMAYGMIGLGAGLLVLTALMRAVFHWRYHRRINQQVA
ncbi:MAG TPA: hypothetical protein VGM26_02415 [Rhizomicrobium sp.]